jgi:hypothetical protein
VALAAANLRGPSGELCGESRHVADLRRFEVLRENNEKVASQRVHFFGAHERPSMTSRHIRASSMSLSRAAR